MVKLSAVIITLNEEQHIGRCLESLKDVVDEIVIVDSLSTDKTEEICKSFGVHFIKQPFLGYRDQKNFATQQASYDYILSLDADEALSEELKTSILQVKESWTNDGYSFNRLNNYCGQWIRHSHWYPDRKIRLYDRRKGEWGGLNIHESVKMHEGVKERQLKGDLLHWTHDTIDEHVNQTNQYSTFSANEYFKKGKKASAFAPIGSATWTFFSYYILKGGFRDGHLGLVICANSAYRTFLKYAKLRQMNLQEKAKRSS